MDTTVALTFTSGWFNGRPVDLVGPDPAAVLISEARAARETTVGVLHDFIIYQRRRNLATGTIEGRRSRITAFEIWLGRSVLDATPDEIGGWLDDLDITPETRYLYLGHLNALFKWAVRTDLIATNPCDKIDRPKRAKRLPRPIDRDELLLAMEYADHRMFAWLCLMALQGFRCLEVARLRVEDVDRYEMTLRVFGKGSKEAVMPLHPDVLVALIRFGIPPSGYMFTQYRDRDDRPLSASTVSKYVSVYLHSLGSDATAHRNRHFFGTRVHALTGDLLQTRDLLRHSSAQTSELYAQVTGDRGREVLGRLAV